MYAHCNRETERSNDSFFARVQVPAADQNGWEGSCRPPGEATDMDRGGWGFLNGISGASQAGRGMNAELGFGLRQGG